MEVPLASYSQEMPSDYIHDSTYFYYAVAANGFRNTNDTIYYFILLYC